jgi:NAD(P)-dependent dehydrogenase (short-subunit alcohol dehydrogenase family)
MHGGRGRTRTGTPVSQKQILSLLCLPFHHAATPAIYSAFLQSQHGYGTRFVENRDARLFGNGNRGRSMRLKDKIAIVVGAGQSPGAGMGNGRATVMRFVEEGAKVLAVDNELARAKETVTMAAGECVPFEADVRKESALAEMVDAARQRWGRIDILHYNVGVSIAGGDAPIEKITEEAFDRIAGINLRGAIMACKHVLPVMRAQRSGAIIMISSVAAWEHYPNVAYKAIKAGMIAFTQQIAIQNAEFGIRANVILPGLMDTPMAVDTRAQASGKSRAEVAAMRDARVPLRHKMGTAWDVANAALFLASDEANFITGVALPVDGGALVNINPYPNVTATG